MPDDAKTPATIAPALPEPTYRPGTHLDMLTDKPLFEHMQRVARMFAESQLVPQHLRGKVPDCFIALHIARRLDEDPLTLMQNIYIVSGKAGWMTQYMIARANKSGRLQGPIRWRSTGQGESLEVTAFATLTADGEEISATASMAMAKAEQWTRNPKYTSMPEHMLRWRSATMLVRLYMPEIMLGLPSAQELEDGGELIEQVDGSYAPAPPQRSDFQPGVEVSDETQGVTGADADPDGEPESEPYQLVDCDGEAHDYQQAGRWANALEKVFDEAANRGEGVLVEMWETNSPTLGRLRSEGRDDLADRVKEYQADLRNRLRAARVADNEQKAGVGTDEADTDHGASTGAADGQAADGPPPGHPAASSDLF